MGGSTWTAERDQRLLLLVLKTAKVDSATLAAAYKTEYNDTNIDDYTPTAKAIKEHLDKLKKMSGGKGASNGTKSSTIGTPKTTPRKPTAAAVANTPTSARATARKATNKTPTHSAKRKRTSKFSSDEMSDGEEDSNDERKMLNSTVAVPPRSSLSRRSKSVAKSYQQSSEDEDEDDDVDAAAEVSAEDVNATAAVDANITTTNAAEGGEQTDLDSITVAGGTGHPTPQGKVSGVGSKVDSSKKRAVKREAYVDSDASDFTPSF